MELFVAAYLHPRLTTGSSNSPILPSKADRFQSTMVQRAYEAAPLAFRVLNGTSPHRALCEDMATKPDPAMWEDITVITDICLCM